MVAARHPEPGAGRPDTLRDALEWLRKHFDPESSRDLCVVFQYRLSGPEGGSFYARVDDGRLDLAEGASASPDVCFRLAADDFFDVLAGRGNADMLFMAGRIEVEGDLSLALKMRRLFRPPPASPER